MDQIANCEWDGAQPLGSEQSVVEVEDRVEGSFGAEVLLEAERACIDAEGLREAAEQIGGVLPVAPKVMEDSSVRGQMLGLNAALIGDQDDDCRFKLVRHQASCCGLTNR